MVFNILFVIFLWQHWQVLMLNVNHTSLLITIRYSISVRSVNKPGSNKADKVAQKNPAYKYLNNRFCWEYQQLTAHSFSTCHHGT